MKTQLLITVKPDFLMWFNSLPFVGVLRENPYIGLYIDETEEQGGELIKIYVSKQPYIIELEPGHHDFMFIDSNSSSKKLIKGISTLAAGMALGGVFGGLDGLAYGTALASDHIAATKEIRDNYMHLCLNEGDLFKIAVKPGRGGTVKIEELK